MNQPSRFRRFAVWSVSRFPRFMLVYSLAFGAPMAVAMLIYVATDPRTTARPEMLVIAPALGLGSGVFWASAMWLYRLLMVWLFRRRRPPYQGSR